MISIAAVNHGSYYDDEIYNLRNVVANDFGSLWTYINKVDAHPPGSYIINKFLFNILGSWEAVKILGGLLNAAALAVFALLAFDRMNSAARLTLTVLLLASATHVMWGASVRWYAYFNPFFTVALAILMFANISLTKRSLLLGAAIAALFYISYAALCAAPVLIAVHLLRERDNLTRRDLIHLLVIGLIGFLVCAPQIYIFVHDKLGASGLHSQTGSFFGALVQLGITLSVGNAVFPLAVAAIVYLGLVGALGLYFLFVKPKTKLDWIAFIALCIGVLAMAATGIGIKPRNSVYLLPLVYFILASAVGGLPAVPARAAFVLIALFQFLGVANVIAHRGTEKGSYDANFKTAMATLTAWQQQCKGRFFVFEHDVVLTYLIEQSHIPHSSPFSDAQDPTVALRAGDCVAVVKTYRSVFSAGAVAAFYRGLDIPELKPQRAAMISEDPNAAAKSWLGKEPFPKFMIEMHEYNVAADVSVPGWTLPVVTEPDE